MKLFLLFIIGLLSAQTPGTVSVSSTILATTVSMTCSFSLTAATDVLLICKESAAAGGIELINTTVHLPKATNSFTWDCHEGTDAVTGIFTRTATGVNWQVTANGTVKTGSF